MGIDKKLPLREQKVKSGERFDKKIMALPGWIKLALILLAIIVLGVVIYGFLSYPLDSGGEATSEGVRNCILSAVGNSPDCSDNDGTLKKTILNGVDLGYCYSLDVFGNCIR